MPRAPRTALALISAAVAALGLAALQAQAPGGEWIVAYCLSREGGSAAAVVPAPAYYEFLHSVHRDVEVDVISLGPRGLVLRGVYAPELGAGVPSAPGEVGGSAYGEAFGLIYYSADRPLGPEERFSWSSWPHARIGSGGLWFTGYECVEAGLKAP